MLTTGRTLYHYNSATMTMREAGRPREAGARRSSRSTPTTRRARHRRRRACAARLPARQLEAEAHYSERVYPGLVWMALHFAKAKVNWLPHDVGDPLIGTPEYKVVRGEGRARCEPRASRARTLESCDSTQAAARRRRCPRGRSRRRRPDRRPRPARTTWEAPPGTCVLVSVLLKPPPERRAPELSLVAGVAVADALERADRARGPDQVAERRDARRRRRSAGSSPRPATARSSSGSASTSTRRATELPPSGRRGSLRTIDGQECARDDVLDAVLAALGARYEEWLAGGLDAVYDGLGSRDFLRGRR